MSELTPEEVGIRLAFQRVVKIVGARNVAIALGCDEGRITRLQSTSNAAGAQIDRRFLKAAELSVIDRLVGAPIMATEICEQAGYSISRKLEPHVALEGMTSHLCSFAKETSEAISALADALRKKDLSIAAATRIHKEIQDVIDSAISVQEECQRVIAGTKPALKAV